MKIAVVKETFPGEKRVAVIPATVPMLVKAGFEVLVQAGVGSAAGFTDAQYEAKGARVVPSREEAFVAEIILQVQCVGANPRAGREDVARLRPGQTMIGMCDPLGAPEAVREAAASGATLLALELIPRITRAQSMDVLSSMATVAGYRAVLLAAMELPKMFPMAITAAGTLSPARTLVIGAGVAGLQAIATARRLGAVVQAYDVRPAVRDQVESLGAKFVDLHLDTAQAEGAGGYAKALGEEFYTRQREQMATVVADSDVVISTAAIPGKKSPLLITRAGRRGHASGVGHRGPGGPARRQLRGQPARPEGRPPRRDGLGSHQPAVRRPPTCQPDVRQEHLHVPVEHGRRRPMETRSGRRDCRGYACGTRRAGGSSDRDASCCSCRRWPPPAPARPTGPDENCVMAHCHLQCAVCSLPYPPCNIGYALVPFSMACINRWWTVSR